MSTQDTFHKIDPRKRRRVLDAAVEEFAVHGYQQASMNRMVQRLNIAKGSLFQYFGNKEGLFRFVFEYAIDLVRVLLDRVKEDAAEADFYQRVGRSLLAGIEFIDRYPRVYQIYLKMIFQENFPLRAQWLQRIRLYSTDYLTPLVEQAIKRGELRPELDVPTTVFFLDALMDRFLQAYCVSFLDAGAGLYKAPPEQVKKRLEAMLELLRQGLGRDDEDLDADSGRPPVPANPTGKEEAP